jgi:hypothetical protein
MKGSIIVAKKTGNRFKVIESFINGYTILNLENSKIYNIDLTTLSDKFVIVEHKDLEAIKQIEKEEEYKPLIVSNFKLLEHTPKIETIREERYDNCVQDITLPLYSNEKLKEKLKRMGEEDGDTYN